MATTKKRTGTSTSSKGLHQTKEVSMQGNYTPKDYILSTLIAAEGKGVTRDYLSKKSKLSDRQVRQYIAELRDDGYIIGQPFEGGYSYNNLTDIRRTIIKEKARVKTLNKRIKKMERAIENQNQLMMEV